MRLRFIPILLSLLVLAAPVLGQLALPPVGGVVYGATDTVSRALEPFGSEVDRLASAGTRLAESRVERLRDLVRRNPETIELDASGNPARKGELLVVAPSADDLVKAQQAGFTILGQEALDGLQLNIVRLGIPASRSLRKAQAELSALLPQRDISADALYFQSGGGSDKSRPLVDAAPPASTASIDAKVGVIDGAPGPAAGISEQRGFTRGAPVGSNHGSAIVSLLRLAGVHHIAVADVYGTDPAGGSALAIARGLDWLISADVRVVTISLVGPATPLLDKAIIAARRRGVTIVAAVGNDGPAAPPAYPASYPGVIAVTGVDGRDRPLIEAGRALHLDYAAPGADMLAADANGAWIKVRGTSYATPLAAARAAAAAGSAGDVIKILDREARHMGSGSQTRLYGRGLLCGGCRRRG